MKVKKVPLAESSGPVERPYCPFKVKLVEQIIKKLEAEDRANGRREFF